MRKICIITCLLAIIAGCKKGSDNGDSLTGTWKLTMSCGGFAGCLAVSSNYYLQLSSQHKYTLMPNDSTTYCGTYTTTYNLTTKTTILKLQGNVTSISDSLEVHFDNDKLLLSSSIITSYFIRSIHTLKACN
ncbi:MAG: hypothetical protein QM731_18125 [Chitinophagaceae bacterium]